MKSRALLVGNFLSKAVGNVSVCEELASHLAQSGWEVLTTSPEPKRLRRLIDTVSTIWTRRHDYDVAQVDVFSGPAFVVAEAACQVLRAADKPFVLTLHGGNLPAFAERWPYRVRRLLAAAEHVTAPSRYLWERMQSYRSDLIQLPNALDLDAYEYRERSAPTAKLVWLRAFSTIYNPSLAVEVVARVVPRFPDIQLKMVGPDKHDGSLAETRRRVQELGLDKHVEFVGSIDKQAVPHVLNQADVFLNTTNIDNTPVSVLEALACGLCVVTTDVGGIPFMVNHQEHALLVPPGDPAAMAAAVERVLTKQDLALHLSRSGREQVARYDWASILPVWHHLLGAAAQRTPFLADKRAEQLTACA